MIRAGTADRPLESPDARSDDAIHAQGGAYFPRSYLTDFFDFLQHNKRDIEVLTYRDLPWGDDCDYRSDYQQEHRNWKGQLASGERDPDKAYVVLQYDVDSRPDRTMNLLREASHLRVPANVMIFNRRVDRRHLQNSGELRLTDYDLDLSLLHELAKKRFEIGYHTNVHERAVFDMDLAMEIFDADVRDLSETFDIRFFSAHGGVPSPAGLNNRDLPFHSGWVDRLKWVHNGHTVRFDGQFSDGGHNSPLRDPEGRDLRDFVAAFKPGKRYRILLHPQHYDVLSKPSHRFSGTRWYDRMLETHEQNPGTSLWSDVKLGWGGARPGRSFRERIFSYLRPPRTVR